MSTSRFLAHGSPCLENRSVLLFLGWKDLWGSFLQTDNMMILFRCNFSLNLCFHRNVGPVYYYKRDCYGSGKGCLVCCGQRQSLRARHCHWSQNFQRVRMESLTACATVQTVGASGIIGGGDVAHSISLCLHRLSMSTQWQLKLLGNV